MSEPVYVHPTTPEQTQPAEIVRAFLLTYTVDRTGRHAPVAARTAAHDALDALAKGT